MSSEGIPTFYIINWDFNLFGMSFLPADGVGIHAIKLKSVIVINSPGFYKL